MGVLSFSRRAFCATGCMWSHPRGADSVLFSRRLPPREAAGSFFLSQDEPALGRLVHTSLRSPHTQTALHQQSRLALPPSSLSTLQAYRRGVRGFRGSASRARAGAERPHLPSVACLMQRPDDLDGSAPVYTCVWTAGARTRGRCWRWAATAAGSGACATIRRTTPSS